MWLLYGSWKEGIEGVCTCLIVHVCILHRLEPKINDAMILLSNCIPENIPFVYVIALQCSSLQLIVHVCSGVHVVWPARPTRLVCMSMGVCLHTFPRSNRHSLFKPKQNAFIVLILTSPSSIMNGNNNIIQHCAGVHSIVKGL